MRRAIWPLVKWSLVGLILGLFVWFNWDQLRHAPTILESADWRPFVIAVLIYLSGLVLTFYRWYILVRAQDLPFRMVDALRLGFIGNLFSILLPGSVGGDVIKAGFIAKEQRHRTRAVATIIVDRIIGLLGLIVLTSLIGAFFWERVWSSAALRVILIFVWSITAALVAGVLLVAVLPVQAQPWIDRLGRVPKIGRVLAELARALQLYRHQAGYLALVLFLATVGHVGFVMTYYYAAQAVPGPTPTVADHYLIVPAGMVIQAVPLTPGNLGVSEQAFKELYEIVLRHESDKGLWTGIVQRMATWIVAALSIFIYLPLRRSVREVWERERLAAAEPSATAPPHSNPSPPKGERSPDIQEAMKPCLSEALTMAASFAEDVAAFADAGCSAMEVWLTKLENHVQQHSAADTRKLLDDRNMTLAAASYQGGLLLSQGEQRRVHYDLFQRRLALCQAFNIGTLLVVADFLEPIDATGLERGTISLKHAAQLAASFGVRLALEFRAKASWCASLDTAVALVEACDEPNLGVAFDVFHYYTGPSKFDDLALLTPRNLAFVQLCDLAGVPREFASDGDRILPGEGDFHLGPILDQLRRIGYDGWVSVELFNPELWKMKSVQVAEAAFTSLRRLLGFAAMEA